METLDNWHYLPHLQLFTVALFFFCLLYRYRPEQTKPEPKRTTKARTKPVKRRKISKPPKGIEYKEGSTRAVIWQVQSKAGSRTN